MLKLYGDAAYLVLQNEVATRKAMEVLLQVLA